MSDLIWKDVKVCCHLDQLRVTPEIMHIGFAQKVDGEMMPVVCNGCDDMQGSDLCKSCVAKVVNVLFENPDWKSSDVIYPKIPEDLRD